MGDVVGVHHLRGQHVSMPGRHCASLDEALQIFASDPLLFRDIARRYAASPSAVLFVALAGARPACWANLRYGSPLPVRVEHPKVPRKRGGDPELKRQHAFAGLLTCGPAAARGFEQPRRRAGWRRLPRNSPNVAIGPD